MALIVNDRVKETSTTAGTGTLDLAGAVTGFVTFVAGIGDTNTTYYAIFEQGTVRWEVGLGTVGDATPDTLARTTVISNSSGSTAKIVFAGTLDVFCTLPASKTVFGKQEGTNFTGSLLVGHATTGTLSTASNNTGVGIAAMDAITSADSTTCVGKDAGSGITSGGGNTFIGQGAGQATSGGSNNTAVGKLAGVSLNTNAHYNILIGEDAGDNISSGDGNVVIGKADVPSATGDRQLSISGYDGSTTTQWIIGANDGNLEVTTNWNPSLSTTGKAFVMGF